MPENQPPEPASPTPGGGPPPLDAAQLAPRLAEAGWNSVHVMGTTGSTNADLLASAPTATDRTVLLAEQQTAGRGRHSRTWETTPGTSLIASVLLRAAGVPPARLGWLPLLTGVALASAIRDETGVRATLKWPNDVHVGGRKVAGILAEVAPVPGPATVVVGFGINASTERDELPVTDATSLYLESGSHPDRSGLAVAVLARLSRALDVWIASGGAPGPLREQYVALSSTLGEEVSVALPGGTVTGLAERIDEAGCLVLSVPGEGEHVVSAGDVTHLRKAQ
ncbi:biotin--[acetyl-CoA-carboxylase] ligase [Hoyosella sp. G463]|uniref:biotin--[biotin carboxyl-carrier protein] ligase n=1 Tax=Lolliginicoccus lacisalsi TaxID=2742202 RepID=A0A927JD15_9ACTN|nr:biotin--[acetyl-CoA-carboxylase] ligase [Lolliginicoccus lacisalsi]MBD8506580.1 biotin--[acetyl-CoA-carboxylase] ligase [Lolliginicoccus lacisalsi]